MLCQLHLRTKYVATSVPNRAAFPANTTHPRSKPKLTLDTVLRSLGLTVFRKREDGEEKKTALDKSRLQALSRSTVHIIPILGAAVII